MIEINQGGDIFFASTEALVNPVNCVGVMGKGLALQFKKLWPSNYDAYKLACERGDIGIGKVFAYETGHHNVRFIINFATKNHWKNQSSLVDIEAGLADLVNKVRDLSITSIAIPALGCGLGGLKWDDVRPLIEAAFASLPDVRVMLYQP